jgi:superfamily II DNA or RNA helicase
MGHVTTILQTTPFPPPVALQLAHPSQPILVREIVFGLCVDLTALRASLPQKPDINDFWNRPPGHDYSTLLRELVLLGRCKIRQSLPGGRRRVETTLTTHRTFEAGGRTWLVLPRACRDHLAHLLRQHGLEPDFVRDPMPEADHASLDRAFADGTVLDPLQRESLHTVLAQKRPGILEFGMGGGKTRLAAGLLRAWAQHRPAFITSAGATDSAQLALGLVDLLGESVALIGCHGITTAAQRARLTADWQRATIIVGTHALWRQIPAVDAPVAGPDSDLDTPELPGLHEPVVPVARSTDQIAFGEHLRTAPLVIVDEVDALPTQRNLSHLRACTPKAFYGLTGSWGLRPDRCDRALAGLFTDSGKNPVLVRVRHREVLASGRVSPAELHAYVFDEKIYPGRAFSANEQKFLSLTHRAVVRHDGRNRLLAEILDHLLRINAAEERGVILCFLKTIEHVHNVLPHLGALRQLPLDQMAFAESGIILHHAQLPTAEKLANLATLRAGKARLVLTTDVLCRGLDVPSIADIVDGTGMKESVRTIQRAGRALRKADGKYTARVHTVADTHDPALKHIAREKLKSLEIYFERAARIHATDSLPWRGDDALTDAMIAAELGHFGL